MNPKTDSTPIEEPAGSIADDLRAAIDEIDSAEELAATDGSETTGDAGNDADNSDPDSGGDAKPVQQVAEPDGEGGPAVEAPPEITAPEHWGAEDREVFTNAPKELQDWLLSRHKAMEGDYTRKAQDISDLKRDYEPVQQLLAPYKANLAQSGISPAQYVERLARADLLLNQNPMEGLKQVAQMYNIDLSQFGKPAEEGDIVDPEVQALRNELADLRGTVNQRQQAESAQQHNTILTEIQSFAEAKDEQGNLAHPHFEVLMEDLMVLAQAERASGRNPVLSDLYDKAVWSNTSTREQMQTAQRTSAAAKADTEARAKAAQAIKASKTVEGSPDGETPPVDMSLRDQIASQM